MPDDLYKIGLNPDPAAGDYSVPNPTRPMGTIGGSDIGANSADDQRVMDLMQQYLNDSSIIDMLNNLLIINNPLLASGGGDTLIAEFFNSDQIVLLFGSPSGGIGVTATGQNRTVTFDGGPIRFVFVGDFGINYQPLAASSYPGTYGVNVYATLFIDGVLLYQTDVAANHYWEVNPAGSFDLSVWMNSIAVMEPGKGLMSFAGLKTGAEMTAALSAGPHTIRVDIQVTNSDDAFIDVSLFGEYYSFSKADTAKITSMQVFDATTIL